MTTKLIIAAVVATILGVLGLSLYYTGKAYLDMRDQRTELAHTIQINELTRAFKEEKEQDLLLQKTEHDKVLSEIQSANMERENEITKKLLTAQRDASQVPIEFGDDLLRYFIYADCLRSKGEVGNSVQGRGDCRTEAENADPTSTGLYFAAITPRFLRAWGDACNDYDDISNQYPLEEWREEYGNFDPTLCSETVITFTPEAALWFTRFIDNDLAYISELIDYAVEGNQIIDKLTEKAPEQSLR